MNLKTTSILLASVLLSGNALADHTFTAHGRVIHSSPVYKTIKIGHEHHRCPERHHSHSGYTRSNYKNEKRHSKDFVITKSNKNDSRIKQARHSQHGSNNKHQERHHDRRPDRCSTGSHFGTKRILKGFDVTYRYKGDTFHTFTKFKPGRRIALNVSISPQF